MKTVVRATKNLGVDEGENSLTRRLYTKEADDALLAKALRPGPQRPFNLEPG